MSQENIQEVTGFITGITKSAEVNILSFQEKGQPGAIALTIETRRYHELFPAGDPILGIEMVAVLQQIGKKLQVVSIYDPEGDFIAADEVPELGQLNHQLDDAKSTDVYTSLIADRQKAVDQIDASTSELEELAREHDAANQVPESNTNYGDPVTDQGGNE
ncbi:hypothetical protein C7818_11933 [Leuconostoc mesenteroides]|uniref:hypothetical protein n=1 Tax=Leuconostoc mesenteroides TaxID=1245 RepID=UPI0010667E61|nr:hypothetical protein [Leuconostoc mesenteroides]TDV88233.1 hypothetical protein C7818_11933 [Leuconostoc mesenteroides]